MSTQPLFHWAFDSLVGGVVADSSPFERDGRAEGDIEVVADDLFGRCAVSAPEHEARLFGTELRYERYTFEAWFRPPQLQRQLTAEGTKLELVVSERGIMHASPAGVVRYLVNFDGAWRHVAVTYDGQKSQLYFDGQLQAAPEIEPAPETVKGSKPFRVIFFGSVAHMRMYDVVLDEAAIQGDMATDRAPAVPDPFRFSLTDENEDAVLLIDDGPPRRMLLWLTNTSGKDIDFYGGDHHFELIFRPGVLNGSAKPSISDPGWLMPVDVGQSERLPIRARGIPGIRAGGAFMIPIEGLKADGTGGTRATQVQLKWCNQVFTDHADELTGERMRPLRLVNHRGHPRIPLHVGFVGGDRILNREQHESKLTIHLTNTAREEPIRFSGPGAAAGMSSLIVSYDVQVADGRRRDWALTRADGMAKPRLNWSATPGTDWDVLREDQGQRIRWILSPNADTHLPAGAALVLEMEGMQGLTSLAQADIVVAYENIPAYQDGSFTITAERSPLLFSDQYVGIGVPTPKGRLHVLHTSQDPADGDAVVIGPMEEPNLRLGHHGKYSWIQSHNGTGLVINPTGKGVAVGSKEPSDAVRLTVAATVPTELPLQVVSTDKPGIGFVTPGSVSLRLEGSTDGFTIKAGDGLADLHAGTAVVRQLRIGGVTIGEAELRRLANPGDPVR